MLTLFIVKKQSETAKGLSTAAAIAFLLNGDMYCNLLQID